MKKFLSLFVAVLMLVSAFSMNVFADRVIGTSTGKVSDGKESFVDNNSSTTDVKLTIGQVGHRYAVDITFASMQINLGDVVWDVNNHKYVITEGNTIQNTSFPITIDNHSDLPVYAKGVVADASHAFLSGAGVTIEMNVDKTNITINKATTKATQGTLQVDVSSDNWGDSVTTIMKNKGDSSDNDVVVATVTVTISQNVIP